MKTYLNTLEKNLNLQTSKNSNNFLKKFIELLQCVFTLNNYGIFHCDIKIENVTYNRKHDCLSVIDFGRSLVIEEETKNHMF